MSSIDMTDEIALIAECTVKGLNHKCQLRACERCFINPRFDDTSTNKRKCNKISILLFHHVSKVSALLNNFSFLKLFFFYFSHCNLKKKNFAALNERASLQKLIYFNV